MKEGEELQRGAARRSVRLAGIALTEGAAEGTLSFWVLTSKKGWKLREEIKKLSPQARRLRGMSLLNLLQC